MVNLCNPNNIKAYYLMIIGLFMAILDVQIVASSIGEIQAALNSSLDEISWVQTSYLIAELIMIPLTGWLCEVFSTRIVFTVSALTFTISSVACGMAWNLESMIVFRILQGFFGGAMIPTVFTAIFIIFPPHQQNRASIMASLVATLGPTIGPTLGGWITTHFSWHWLFFINLIPGIVSAFGVYRFLDVDKPKHHLLKNIDILGVVLIAVSLSSLELLLKKGNVNGWFESPMIIILFLIVIASTVTLIWRELDYPYPIVNLKVLTNPNLSIGCFLSFILGVGLFGTIYLLPVMLNIVKHYDSLHIGLIMFVAGFFQFFSGPLAGILSKKIDPRYLLFFGLVGFGISTIWCGFLTVESDLNNLFWPQALKGMVLIFCFLPLTSISLGSLPHHEIKNASSLLNLTRNLGGAVGIAIIDTILTSNIKTCSALVRESLTQGRIDRLIGYYTPDFLLNHIGDDWRLIMSQYKLLDSRIMHQAMVLAFNNLFIGVGLSIVISGFFIFFLKPVKVSKKVIDQGGH